MIHIEAERELQVPAQQAWQLLANFGDISWAPGMDNVEVEGEGVGMLRRISMPGAEPVEEILEAIDHQAMTFSYAIPGHNPMPVTDYRAGAKVVAVDDNRCLLQWWGTSTPQGISEAEATEMMRGFYAMLLGWVADHLEAK